MLKQFYPYEYEESVFTIDYNKLFEKGYKAILFDIDNTLVPHGEDSTEQVDELIHFIQGIGFKTLFLSNNSNERIRSFLKNIDSLYICEADKPQTQNYLKALEMLGVKKDEAVVIGDQVFTDVLGANRSGIASILVKFIRRKDEKKIGKRRRVEQVILMLYSLNKSCCNRIGDIHKKEIKENVVEER